MNKRDVLDLMLVHLIEDNVKEDNMMQDCIDILLLNQQRKAEAESLTRQLVFRKIKEWYPKANLAKVAEGLGVTKQTLYGFLKDSNKLVNARDYLLLRMLLDK